MPLAVTVTAPSRLHFGLLSFGGQGRQFGGVGAMVDGVGVVLQVRAAERLTARGEYAARVEQFARRWQEFHRRVELPCEMAVTDAPQEHTGLGVGTQLGLSVAAGLSAFFHLPPQTPVELAISVGRGQRSAVGTYGFALGGLIVERGKLPGEAISPLDCHLDLPAQWGAFLARPRGAAGLANIAEAQAFAELPRVPTAISDELIRIVREELVPVAAQADFAAFSAAVYRYGRLSGECFAPLQGGPYNGPEATAIVELFRAHGLVGVGQSSWGPTIFAFTESNEQAQRLAPALSAALRAHESEGVELLYGPVNNGGARIEVSDSG